MLEFDGNLLQRSRARVSVEGVSPVSEIWPSPGASTEPRSCERGRELAITGELIQQPVLQRSRARVSVEGFSWEARFEAIHSSFNGAALV